MQKISKELSFLMKESKYKLEKTKMIDEDVNLDVSHIKSGKFKNFSAFQNQIYTFIEDYRNILIAEEEKREMLSAAPTPSAFQISMTNANNQNGGLVQSKSLQMDKDANQSKFSSSNYNNNSKLLTSDYDYMDNKIFDDQYDQMVVKIEQYMRICREQKYEVKEASLIHMLNYIFYYRPKDQELNQEILVKIAEAFETYVANLLICELGYYEKCEDSRYAHLFPYDLQNRDSNLFSQGNNNGNTNYLEQDENSFDNNPSNNGNSKQMIAFDFIQQETLWEYISFYALYIFQKQKSENKINNNNNQQMLQKMVYSFLQLCIFKFRAQEQAKIRESTLKQIEDVFLKSYLHEEFIVLNNFIFLRYLLLIQFRNRGLLQDILNRVISKYKIQIPFFIEKIYSLYCENDYIQNIILFLNECWWQIMERDVRTELFERVLVSTQTRIYTQEDRQQFITIVKEKLRISNEDDIFFPCISNEDYCALYSQQQIEQSICQLFKTNKENLILQYQYYIIKYILNNQNEQLLANKITRNFSRQKDINKRVIQMIFNEMKSENAKHCLKLLYVVYKKIFMNNEWQDLKHTLFLSYPFLLMKQLDKKQEEETQEKIRQSYLNRENSAVKRSEEEQLQRSQQNISNLQQLRLKKNIKSIQTTQKGSIFQNQYLVETPQLSRYNPISKALENQQRRILFLLRLGFTIIEQRESIIEEAKFDSLFFSNTVSDYLPFEEGNESNTQFLFFNEFFPIILKIIDQYKMLDNNKIIILEISKIIGYLNQIKQNAFTIKEFPILISQIKLYPESVQNNLIDLIVSMSLENGEAYYKLVEENFLKESEYHHSNNLPKLKFNSDSYERKFDSVKNIRIKIPYAFQFVFKLINNRALTRESTLIFLILLKKISKLEYNQVNLQCCISQILKIIKQNNDPDIQKLLFNVLEQLSLNMNVQTLSKLMKFFRPLNQDKGHIFVDKDQNDEETSNLFSLIPVMAMQNISSINSDNKSLNYETSYENLKNNYIEILSLLKKLCNRNLQAVYTNNSFYLDFSKKSFISANNLGLFSNDNFSFIITFRLHEFEDNIQGTQQQYILKIQSDKSEREQCSLEILIEKSCRDNNYGICIRYKESDILKSKSSNLDSSIMDEDSQTKQQDFFKVDLESSKWYLLGICYTNKPPNNNYQAGRFYLFLNGNQVFYSGTNKFDLQKIKNLDCLILGNDESKKQGLQGQISNFFMSNSFMEGKDIFQMFQFYQEGRISNYPNYFESIRFVLQLNISSFQNKELISTQEVNNGLECQEKEKLERGNFLSKFFSKSQKQIRQTKFISVQAGGNLFYIQKMTLVEACLQVGNIDIFLFIIQIVAKNQDFTNKQSNEIVADIFNLLSEFYLRYREYLETLEKQRLENFTSNKCEKFLDFNDDLKIFLQDDGFRIISKLLYDFIISKKGCEVFLVQWLVRFLETLKPQQELFFQGVHDIIMNMEIWCLAGKKIQEKVLEWVLSNVKQNLQLKKYLLEKEYFQKIFLFQNSMMFHSERGDEQEYMRSRLNDIILILIQQSETDKTGENFGKLIEIFYQFFIFTLYDEKIKSVKLKRISEFLEMFDRILKSPKMTSLNLKNIIYIKYNIPVNENTKIQEVSILNVWQTILQQIKLQNISYDPQQNQINQQIITKILKNLKRILEVKEKLQAKIENYFGKTHFFYQDLEKIMLDLSDMLFCNESILEISQGKKNQCQLNRNSSVQQNSSEKRYFQVSRDSGESSSKNRDIQYRNMTFCSANESYFLEFKDDKDTQEQLYIDILSACINFDQPQMRLSLLLKILDANIERIDKQSRDKLFRMYISKSDTPSMLKSINFYPDFVKFISKLMKLDRAYFNQICAKYLAYKLSYELDDFLQDLVSYQINGYIYTILNFLDEGLKIILNPDLSDQYGAYIKVQGDEVSDERKTYTIFRVLSILEDMLIIKSQILMKPISSLNKLRKSTTIENSQSSRTSISHQADQQQFQNEIKLFSASNNYASPEFYSYSQSSQTPPLFTLPFTQFTQQQACLNQTAQECALNNISSEQEYLKQQQNSTIFLSIFMQCFEYLKEQEIIYSTIPQILQQKEKIKVLESESSFFQGLLGIKNINNFDNNKKHSELENGEKESKGNLISNLNLIFNADGQSKSTQKTSQIGSQVKAGGIMRLVTNFLFQFIKKCEFEEDFILSLNMLQNFIFNLKPNTEQIGDNNVKFLQNRFIKFPFCVQREEDLMYYYIRQYLFCSLLHLIKSLKHNRFGNAPYKSFSNSNINLTNNSYEQTPQAERLYTIQEVDSMSGSVKVFTKLGLNSQSSSNTNNEKTPSLSQALQLSQQSSLPLNREFSAEIEEKQIRAATSNNLKYSFKRSLEQIKEAPFEEKLNKIDLSLPLDQNVRLDEIQNALEVQETPDHEFGFYNRKREQIQYQSFGGIQAIVCQNNHSIIESEKKKSDIHLLSPNILRKKSDSILQTKSSNQESMLGGDENDDSQMKTSQFIKRSSKICEEEQRGSLEIEQNQMSPDIKNEQEIQNYQTQESQEQIKSQQIEGSYGKQTNQISKQSSYELDKNSKDKAIHSALSLDNQSIGSLSPLTTKLKTISSKEQIINNNKETNTLQINMSTPQNIQNGFNNYSFNLALAKSQSNNQMNNNNNCNEASMNLMIRSKSISNEGFETDFLVNKTPQQKQQAQILGLQSLKNNLSVSHIDYQQNTPRLSSLSYLADHAQGQISHISQKDRQQDFTLEQQQIEKLERDIQNIKIFKELLLFINEFMIQNGNYILYKYKQAAFLQSFLSEFNRQRVQSVPKMNSIHSDYSAEGGNSGSSQQHLVLYQGEEKNHSTKIREKIIKIEKVINEKIKAIQVFQQVYNIIPQNSNEKIYTQIKRHLSQSKSISAEYNLYLRSIEKILEICESSQANNQLHSLNQLNEFFKNDSHILSKNLLQIFHIDCYYSIKLVEKIRQYQAESSYNSAKNTPKSNLQKQTKDYNTLFQKVTDKCLLKIKSKHKEEKWLQNKVVSKWDNQLKNMVSQKGIWYQREKQNGEIFYKLKRYQDEYGRRFFIGPDLSKGDGFYSSPTSRNKASHLLNHKSINIPSLDCLDQQQQQFLQRQSVQHSKYQQKYPSDSLVSQQDNEDENIELYGIQAKDQSFESNEMPKPREAFKSKYYQNQKKSSSDNVLSEIQTNFDNKRYSDQIEAQQSSEDTYEDDSQDNQRESTKLQENSQVRGLLGTSAIISKRRNGYMEKADFIKQNSGSQNTDEQQQQRTKFFRSPKPRSKTVAETAIDNSQESYKKYMQEKYHPTQEQIEQSEITPKRPSKNKYDEQLEKIAQRQANNFQVSNIENLKIECEYITLKCSYYGYVVINEEHIQFICQQNKQRPTEHMYTLYGSHIDSMCCKKQKKKLQMIDILSIHSRRFNMKEIAIEIFTNNSKTYYFNFYNQKQRGYFFDKMEMIKQNNLNIIEKLQKNNSHLGISNQQNERKNDSEGYSSDSNYQEKQRMQQYENDFSQNNKEYNAKKLNNAERIKNIELIVNRVEHFKQKKFTEKWKKGELSNFDYLMLINQYSSRSFNDITQYPVFPWIFNRYDKQDIDLNNPSHYRDLSKPVGALNPERLEEFQKRYQSSYSNDFSSAYFYSSHYCSQAFVYNYLIRLEPYTKLHFDFMAKKFDCPQRLFYSIPNTWFSCLTNANDLRELIPEFFYLPEFLKPKPHLQLGNLPNGKSINSVELPNWANNPEHFIAIHRKGLESPYVSKNLGRWIDLIFGSKQRSYEDSNIFPDCCYQDYIFSRTKNDNVQQIIQMSMSILVGQCPSPIFNLPHDQKNQLQVEDDINLRSFDFKEQELEGPFKNKTIIGFSQIGKNIYIYDTQNQIYSIRTNHLMKNFNSRIFKDKNIQNEYEFKERGINTNYQLNSIMYPFNEQIMFVGGFQDSSFRIYKDLKQIQKIHYHKKPISIIRGSDKHNLVFCTSEDLRISVWDVQKESGYKLQHLFYIYGHNQQIKTICLSDSQKIIFSTDKDRVCLIHSYKGKFLNSFAMRHVESDDYATLSCFSPDCSQIFLSSFFNKIQLYNLNGEVLFDYSYKSKILNNIIQVDFFLETSILIGTQTGQVNILQDYHKYISNKNDIIVDQQQFFFKSISKQTNQEIRGFVNLSDKSDYDILCITKQGTFKAFKKQVIKEK
ncbi:hypothetical protein ABPG72_008391 [Tetrahymena utriculariae]